MQTVPQTTQGHHTPVPESGQVLSASRHESRWARIAREYQEFAVAGGYDRGPRGDWTMEEVDHLRRTLARHAKIQAELGRPVNREEAAEIRAAVDAEIEQEIDDFYAHVTDPDRSHDFARESL